jgi:flavin reductase (DIM6/NTAB) family NADH-FMN oxidoreductase RutF
MNATLRPEIDSGVFRRVMGRFATGVTVITVEHQGVMHGMTANAFMSGSLEPPLCVVSIAKRAHTHAMMLEARHFGVNFLAETQADVSEYFAGRRPVGLDVAVERIGPAVLLADACARIVAEIAARHDCGDHTIFIGHILHLEADDRAPLLYHSGRYHSLDRRGLNLDVGAPEFW